jgi:hypothetical protein
MEKYYEIIMDLLEWYNKDQISKEVIDCIPQEDIQAARRWTYQKQKNRSYPDSAVLGNADQIQNDFDKDEGEWW